MKKKKIMKKGFDKEASFEEEGHIFRYLGFPKGNFDEDLCLLLTKKRR